MMHNYDFDILLRSVHLSPKLQILKSKKYSKNQVLYVQHELGVRIFI